MNVCIYIFLLLKNSQWKENIKALRRIGFKSIKIWFKKNHTLFSPRSLTDYCPSSQLLHNLVSKNSPHIHSSNYFFMFSVFSIPLKQILESKRSFPILVSIWTLFFCCPHHFLLEIFSSLDFCKATIFQVFSDLSGHSYFVPCIFFPFPCLVYLFYFIFF